jgi:hypothetical protein
VGAGTGFLTQRRAWPCRKRTGEAEIMATDKVPRGQLLPERSVDIRGMLRGGTTGEMG